MVPTMTSDVSRCRQNMSYSPLTVIAFEHRLDQLEGAVVVDLLLRGVNPIAVVVSEGASFLCLASFGSDAHPAFFFVYVDYVFVAWTDKMNLLAFKFHPRGISCGL